MKNSQNFGKCRPYYMRTVHNLCVLRNELSDMRGSLNNIWATVYTIDYRFYIWIQWKIVSTKSCWKYFSDIKFTKEKFDISVVFPTNRKKGHRYIWTIPNKASIFDPLETSICGRTMVRQHWLHNFIVCFIGEVNVPLIQKMSCTKLMLHWNCSYIYFFFFFMRIFTSVEFFVSTFLEGKKIFIQLLFYIIFQKSLNLKIKALVK